MFLNFKFTKLQSVLLWNAILFVSILTFVPAFSQVRPTIAAERLNGLSKRKLLQSQSLLKDVKFRNIGPSVMSGRVVDVDVNPADPIEFYVAYATGGLWHTSNNGQSFVPVFDHEDVIGMGDIAVNWRTAEIWVGTGEANSSRSSYSGTGVYKSNDTGRTWQYLGLPESHHIGKIILHPMNKNTAWVAAIGHLYSPNKERGVYKTTDGGKTWKQALCVDDNTGAIDWISIPKILMNCTPVCGTAKDRHGILLRTVTPRAFIKAGMVEKRGPKSLVTQQDFPEVTGLGELA